MKPRILIVDDDAVLCEELAEVLTGNGYSVETALDGLDGLAAIRKGHYDLVLLDIKMPHINGLETLQEIKQGEHAPKVMVLSANHSVNAFLGETAGTVEDYPQRVLGLADGVMNKPCDIEILLSRIRNLLSKPVPK